MHHGPLPVRPQWLALHDEPVIDPRLPIVDAHHHLWARPGWSYLLDDLDRDVIESGQRIVSSVFVQCRTMYRDSGPALLRPLGETEFAARAARQAELKGEGAPRLCEAIVCHADLTLGAGVARILEAHREAGAGHVRGVRHSTAWDADPDVSNPELGTLPKLMSDARFREGFACLAPLGLSFDAWVYHPQIDELTELARQFPDTPIVLNHAGGLAGVGPYAARRSEEFARWRKSMQALARCANVNVKLGGLAMRVSGGGYHERPVPPSSADLAQSWQPVVATCIDFFGADRCMFESNFPVDNASCSYRVLWNAFKRLAEGASISERSALFSDTATRFYKLTPVTQRQT